MIPGPENMRAFVYSLIRLWDPGEGEKKQVGPRPKPFKHWSFRKSAKQITIRIKRRAAHVKSNQVDSDLVRGISVAKALSGFGRLWKTSPTDLAPKEKEGLWHRSAKALAASTLPKISSNTLFCLSFVTVLGWKQVVT